ncbi:hypothetical protein ACKKBG_A01600 [Auxenochlorella protothecoides x Auxenochlorella symbiontica]
MNSTLGLARRALVSTSGLGVEVGIAVIVGGKLAVQTFRSLLRILLDQGGDRQQLRSYARDPDGLCTSPHRRPDDPVAGELQRLKKQVAALLAENEALRNRHRKLRQLDASCAQSGQAAAKEAVSEGGQQSSAKHFIKASRTRNTLPAPAETLISPLKDGRSSGEALVDQLIKDNRKLQQRLDAALRLNTELADRLMEAAFMPGSNSEHASAPFSPDRQGREAGHQQGTPGRMAERMSGTGEEAPLSARQAILRTRSNPSCARRRVLLSDFAELQFKSDAGGEALLLENDGGE